MRRKRLIHHRSSHHHRTQPDGHSFQDGNIRLHTDIVLDNHRQPHSSLPGDNRGSNSQDHIPAYGTRSYRAINGTMSGDSRSIPHRQVFQPFQIGRHRIEAHAFSAMLHAPLPDRSPHPVPQRRRKTTCLLQKLKKKHHSYKKLK